MFGNYSSKIKPIYIELPDYSFSHGAADTNNPDPLYIGRQKIINRLTEILSNTASKTGAYLITGYRGMGKSSYVQKVVDELSFDKLPDFYLLGRFLLLYSFFLIIASFDTTSNHFLEYFFSVICLVLISVFIFLRIREANRFPLFENEKTDNNRIKTFNRVYNNPVLRFIRIVIWKPFVIHNIINNKERYKNIIQFIYIVCIVTLIIHGPRIFELIFSIDQVGKYDKMSGFYKVSLILYILILFKIIDYIFHVSFRHFYKPNQKASKTKNNHSIGDKIRNNQIVDFFLEHLKKLFNFNNHIYIRINFGYDDLRETDILRLVARNLRNQYSDYLNNIKKNIIWKVVYLSFLIILSSVSYFNTDVYMYATDIKISTNFTEYFPSQTKEFINDPINYKPIIHHQDNIYKKTCNFIDYNMAYFYYLISYNTQEYLLFGLFDDVDYPMDNTVLKDGLHKFNAIPLHLDYFFIFYFIIFFLLTKISVRLKIFDLVTHKGIISDLDLLNERIRAQVSTEKSGGFDSSGPFSFLKISLRKSKVYPIADVREIEKSIIEILEKIEKIPSFLFKPSVTFIFDELDKIEPQISVMIGDKESAESSVYKNHHLSFTPEGARERQYAIQKLLSNLKYFLSTAKAKFIFIAGREMYDASLADVSDRNYFIGSIFNDVIYVDSFLSDPSDNKRSDVTSLVENYVCKAILPKHYIFSGTEYNLMEYRRYLCLNSTFIDKNTDRVFELDEKKFTNEKIEKIINTLQHFIMYLTHVSNGSPKRLSSAFEKYVQYFDEKDSCDLLFIRAYSGKSTLFLHFDSDDQHKIGLIHYLASPITYKILNTIKNYDDKLLYSASFLIDHLFKFHRHGFSYRNIENAPELIEINKTPELRSFIATIIQYLTQIHIHKLESGLHDFRFNKRISHEIAYLSKISEDASAAFNFTLDESQAIKLHYHRTLSRLIERYKGESHPSNSSDFIRSIGNIHMILGDLHFYDNDYNEAITEYQDAVQFIRGMKPNKLSVSLVVLLIRNMLKLGHSFEKRKTYDSAFLVFTELTDILIEYRNIDLSELGLQEFSDHFNNRYIGEVSNKQKSDESFHLNIKPLKKQKVGYNIKPDFLAKSLTENLTPLKENILNKISAFEGLRIIYQPLLAKLQIIEKSHIGGITKTDLDRIDSEFYFLQKAIAKEDKTIMACEFWNQVGNILFYKNGRLADNHDKHQPFKDCKTCHDESIKEFNCPTSCSACYYYYRSIMDYLKYIEGASIDKHYKPREIFNRLIKLRETNHLTNINPTSLNILAGILSNLSDTYFSCSRKCTKIEKKFFNEFLKIITPHAEDFNNAYRYIEANCNEKLHAAFILCYLSAHFYKKADEYKKSTWQYTKLLYMFNAYINNHNSITDFKIINYTDGKSMEEKVLSKIIKDTYGSYEHIHRTELNREKSNYDKTNKKENIPLYNLTIHTDLIEPLTIFKHIRLKYKKKADINFIDFYGLKSNGQEPDLKMPNHVSVVNFLRELYFRKDISLPNSSYLLIYDKILMLKYKEEINKWAFKLFFTNECRFFEAYNNMKSMNDDFVRKIREFDVLNKTFRAFFKENEPKNLNDDKLKGYHFLVHLICDSIYSLHEIISSMNTYGRCYILSASYQALIHESLAEWSHYYKIMEWENRKNPKFFGIEMNVELSRLIGPENMIFIDPAYQCERALNLFYSARETHTEGRAYQYIIEEMSFLDDDFNDNSYHFFASLEKFKIVTGLNEEKIEKLARMYPGTSIYRSKSYEEIKPEWSRG